MSQFKVTAKMVNDSDTAEEGDATLTFLVQTVSSEKYPTANRSKVWESVNITHLDDVKRIKEAVEKSKILSVHKKPDNAIDAVIFSEKKSKPDNQTTLNFEIKFSSDTDSKTLLLYNPKVTYANTITINRKKVTVFTLETKSLVR